LANGRVRRDCDVPAAGSVLPQALVILRLLSADCLMSVSSTYLSPNVEKSYIFRPMAFEPTRPHNDLPSLPPPLDVETTAVLKACALDPLPEPAECGWRP